MKILGIDPGLKATGYGLIAFKSAQSSHIELLETGTIEPRAKDLIQNRLNKVHTLLDELIQQYNPDVLVLEKLYAHHKHPITASILGHVRGVICLLCAQENVSLVEYSVKRIRKAVTGNGNASKQQVRKTVANVFKIDETKLVLDASDALALALGYVYIDMRNI